MLGASILEMGAPNVQKLSISLKVPNDKHMTSRVQSSEFIEIENILIAPSKGNLSRSINPANIEYLWGDIYNSDIFYPGKLTDLNTAKLGKLKNTATIVRPTHRLLDNLSSYSIASPSNDR